jgi:hypothetical protein
MVLFSPTAEDDLVSIVNGLAMWGKHPLGYDHAMRYVAEIRTAADYICQKSFHAPTVSPVHKLYGSKIHTYRRNKHTHWYIIYNWNAATSIAYVTKILNNFTTDALSH